jgi:hypothetical protein
MGRPLAGANHPISRQLILWRYELQLTAHYICPDNSLYNPLSKLEETELGMEGNTLEGKESFTLNKWNVDGVGRVVVISL